MSAVASERPALIGRDAETAAIERLLDDARAGRSGVLVVRGEAGVGKSALLEHAVARAEGFTVLRALGIEVESELAYAALHQVLRPILDRIGRLPAPQAAALRGAFALSSETVTERFRVSLGVLGLLAEAAEERPLLCVVDDAQWLDRASADALVFVARRLEAEPIVLLFAARDVAERPFVVHGVPERRLNPLSPADSRSLLARQLPSLAAPVVVDWLVENANGNPLALIELPGALRSDQLAGQDPLTALLPPATSVEQVYLERVDALPPAARRLLVLAAAEETGARAVVERGARELGLETAELAAAESAGLLRVGATRIAFRHPLVRSAVYRGAGFAEREHAHRTLALAWAAEGSADRAAWHRAAATVGADDEVAEELERTAGRAALRSGWAAAAAALERAAQLSADGDSRARRLVAAADAAWHGGLPERATALLDRAEPVASDPLLRGELDHIRGVIELRCGNLLDAGVTLIEGAARVAPHDARRAFEMLVDAGSVAGRSGDVARMADVGRRIADLERSDDALEALLADLVVGVCGVIEGTSAGAVPLVLDAIGRSLDSDDPRLLSWAATGASTVGEEALEAALLRRAVSIARASGAVDAVVLALETAVSAAITGGRYTDDGEATEGLTLAREAGLPNAASCHLAALAWFAALAGDEDACRARAAEVAEATRRSKLANANSIAEWAVAVLDLGLGRYDAAIDRLEALRSAPLGVAHPFYILLSAPDLVEACVRGGRLENARSAGAVLEGFAQAGAPAWARALAARCRGLLSDDEAADTEFAHALRLHDESSRPFDRARTQLLYGEFLRRRRRRGDAREQLRAALETFEGLGAEPWGERARGELRATGETARKRDPSTIDQLTPQELQIARLVGEGYSNKEVAAHLFLSPRTVEYHLRKVFAKLGITSRAELIRHAVDAVPEPAGAA